MAWKTNRFVAGMALAMTITACRDDAPPPLRSTPLEPALKPYVLDSVPPITHPLELSFDDKVDLLGYDIDPAGALPRGGDVTLTLYWMLTRKVAGRWKLLTHVLDPAGVQVLDLYNAGPLRAGKRGHPRLPPSNWSVGKVYVDELRFKLPQRGLARRVSVVAGVYSTSTLAMSVTRGSGDARGRALVGTFDVAVDNPGFTVQKLDAQERIEIDGRLDEAAWRRTPTLGPFLRVSYGAERRSPAPVRGEARLRWNSEGLYLGYEIRDEDVGSVVTPAADEASNALALDGVGFVLDSDPDGHADYELEISPRNMVAARRWPSGSVAREGNTAKLWAAHARSAVAVKGTVDQHADGDKGYVVEAMLPWQSFDLPGSRAPEPGSVLKMNLYAKNQGVSASWAPSYAKDDSRRATRFGTVVFAAGE